MRPTIEQLQAYYRSAPGAKAAARLRALVAPMLAHRPTDRVLGLGYCGPVLDSLLSSKIERVVQVMPALTGVCAWPARGPNLACLADEKALPFADALFDQVIMMHVLEFADPARRLLRELWRVLAPAGELIVLAPNRSSLMTLVDTTPFGNGRPFSRNQLETLLEDAMFEPQTWTTALAMPHMLGGPGWDRWTLRWWPDIGGVHIIRAAKTDGIGLVRGAAAAPENSWAPA
jgi:SAM-dependent methyltransferase